MVLFTILLLTLIILTVLVVTCVSVFGAGVIVIFGDVIVCAAFIVLIMRLIFKKKR